MEPTRIRGYMVGSGITLPANWKSQGGFRKSRHGGAGKNSAPATH